MAMPINLKTVLNGTGQTTPLYSEDGICVSNANGLAAAGTTTSDATVMSAMFNEFTTVGSNAGGRFTSRPAGSISYVQNRTATALKVYPPTGGSINGATVNEAYSVASGVGAAFFAITSSNLASLKGAAG